MKRPALLLLAALSIILQARATDPATRQTDSLYRSIPALQGEARLRRYEKLQELARGEWSIDSLVMLLDEYRQEAHRQQNAEHEATAVRWKIDNLADHNRNEEALQEIAPALQFMERTGQWDRYYETCHVRSDITLHSGKYEDALAAARETYDFAKAHNHIQGMATALADMGRAYQGTGLISDAENSYKEALQLFDQVEIGWIGSLIFTTYDYYAGLLGEQERYTEQLEVARRFEALYDRYRSAGKTSPGVEMDIDAAYIGAYVGLGDAAKARKHLDHLAQNSLMGIELAYLHLQHNTIQVLYAEKRFAEALQVSDSMRRTMEARGSVRSVLSILGNKAMVAFDGGLYRDAAEAYKEWKELSDSIRSADNAEALNDLRTVYEVDKLEAQKRARENYLWLAGGIILLLGVVLAGWIVYSRRIRRKNLSLYEQLQAALHDRKQSEQILSTVPEEQLSREMQLFRRVDERVKAEKLFTDPGLNRKALAELAGTNEIYMAEAIREATGLNVASYIAELRLRYSLELLAGDPSLTLDAVAVDSGHGSYSAFFRTFTRQYGITPSEYRRLSMTKKTE